MKQLLYKEWREHFKTALIGLAIFALLLTLQVRSGATQLQNFALGGDSQSLASWVQPLLSDALLKEAVFFCAIFGALLGWLQIQAEKHPDLRAFLLHRPVARTTLLWSKLICGAGLYALGAGVPLAGLVIYAVTPGHVAAPFEWAMVLPGLNAFLLGLVFYAAGLLTALRPARWYGSRMFGLAPALIAWGCLFELPEFWQSLAVIGLAGAILGVAVWGGFQTGGDYSNQAWPGRLSLSIVCALAGIILCGGAAVILAKTISPSQPERYCYYQLTRDGGVYRVSKEGLGPVNIVDLNGHPLLDKKTGKTIRREAFDKLRPASISTWVSFLRPWRDGERNWNRWYCNRLRYYMPWQQADKTLWYLTRAGRLAGYDAVTRRPVGVLVPDNDSGNESLAGSRFAWPENYSRPNDFESYNNQPRLLASARSLYLVDVENRTVKPLVSAGQEGGIGGYSADYDQDEVLVVTRDFIRLMNLEGATELQITNEPTRPGGSTTITVSRLETTNQFAVELVDFQRSHQIQWVRAGNEIQWVRGVSDIMRRQQLPPLPEIQWDFSVEQGCLLIIPTAVRMSLKWIVCANFVADHAYDKWDALSLIPVGFSILMGWSLGRRLHFTLRDQAAWAGFNLIFGIPGLLAFLSVQEWPAKAICPHCKRLRRVDREHCEYCGGEFNPPERNGTEIFEPLPAAGGAGTLD
jgi:hypothetical protein